MRHRVSGQGPPVSPPAPRSGWHRWSQASLALFLVGGAGALGIGVLSAGAAQALPAAGSCGTLITCPPSGTIASIKTSSTTGTVIIDWTPGQVGAVIPPTSGSNAPMLNVAWTPSTSITIPTDAPQPDPSSVRVSPTSCAPASPTSTTEVCTYQWPVLFHGYVLNGTYQVSGTAIDCPLLGCSSLLGMSEESSVATVTQETTVTNLPATPTGVKAVTTANGSQVVITWAPNPEPDIADYQVVRNDGEVVCTIPPSTATPPATSYTCTDAPTKDGSYSYEVVALRYGATYTNTVSNDEVARSAATTPLAVSGTSANAGTTVTTGGTGTVGPGSAGFTAPSPNKTAKVGGSGTFNATPSPAVVAQASPTTVDPGFEPTLPYGTTVPPTAGTNPPSALAAPTPHKSGNSIATIAAVGAGLLIAVIALHGLWLRAEVRRAGILEVLDPDH